jgi:hypothetical protein
MAGIKYISFASLIQRNVSAASTSTEPEPFCGRREKKVLYLSSPSPIPNTKQKASLILSQRRPDGLMPRLVQVPPYLYLVTESINGWHNLQNRT